MSRVLVPMANRLHVYHAACWVLGLVAFSQLLLVGIALALGDRRPAPPEVVERVVTEYVRVPVEAPPASAAGSAIDISASLPSSVESASTWAPAEPVSDWDGELPGTNRPRIKDPEVEALVEGAQVARVDQDLARAVTKLFAAEKLAPAEPNVLYELAQVYELAGNYEKAGDYYQKVMGLGITGAGSLYADAAQKLREGFGEGATQHDQITLGRIIKFEDSRVKDGQKIILTVPVLAAPGKVKNPEGIEVQAFLYDKIGEEVLPAPEGAVQQAWAALPVDFRRGEEKVHVSYFIPAAVLAEQHLLGGRHYHGHVVKLYQDGELIDQKAWPRTLAAEMNAPESDPLFLPEEYIPEDINPANPLLPPLPR